MHRRLTIINNARRNSLGTHLNKKKSEITCAEVDAAIEGAAEVDAAIKGAGPSAPSRRATARIPDIAEYQFDQALTSGSRRFDQFDEVVELPSPERQMTDAQQAHGPFHVTLEDQQAHRQAYVSTPGLGYVSTPGEGYVSSQPTSTRRTFPL